MKNNSSSHSPRSLLRPALKVLSLVLLVPVSAFAATFYVSPTGSDSNPGTQAAPFRSITRAQSAASSGDTVLLRGGTYSGFTIAGSDSNYNFVHHITKSGITYAAFTGETPIFNFAGTTTAKRVAAFRIATGVSNVTFRGFQVVGVPVGSQKQSECFRIQGNAHFDRVVCRDGQANGFYFTTDGSGSCTNCDAYNLIGVGQSVGNTDGFGAHAGAVTFTGCRSWNNSDDGFDCISTSGQVIFDHCWAYNMRNGGDSNGFKVGGYGLTGAVANPMPSHIVRFCLSANNGSNGFYANHQPGKAADWTNNTAYNNGNANFNMLEQVSTTNRTDIPGTREVFHYNIAFTGTTIANDNNPASNKTNNSWTKSGVSVTSADFQSLDATQITAARQADGSLPVIAFMRLTSGSDLAGMGCFTGSTPTPNTYQAESAAASGGVTFDSNNSGFHGTGFANFPASGGTLTFNSVDGNGGGAKSLAIRYANGGTASRTGTITVNGMSANITFNPTGSWTTWATLNVNITLNNNASNTIAFSSVGNDLGNIDEITVP
ncbi:MAG TPA: carbohydrate-binding protein [Opitutaceae bacterium]|nr:carbohydrate-binding protein [Opitutaceae bacterium]